MVSMQKLTSLFGKQLKDRMGNLYRIVSVIPNDDGSVKKIIFENSNGNRSQRLPNGRVKAGGVSPRDILLTSPTRQRGAIMNPFFDGLDDDGYVSSQFEDIEDDIFMTSPRKRPKFGTFVGSGGLDFDNDDIDLDDIIRGPNSSSKTMKHGDIEITIKVKGNK